jgi:CheY-like chemotaxis protein
MPRLNGLQAIEKIQTFVNEINEKSAKAVQMPQFYFLTSYIETQFEKHALGKGVKKVFEKPLTQAHLQSIFNS